uniref:MACPF domain-containing protein n=1 Tax=Cyclopterus lumpus TaxID=8103 RepID=A0A8C2WBN7_CYCLU
MLSFSNPPLLGLSLLLFLVHHSPVLSFGTWTNDQCRQASFVPGHNLVGQGYDAVTLKRRAHVIDVTTYLNPSGSCNLYKNPHHGNVLQKVPVSAGEWRAFSHCNVQYDHTEHNSVRYSPLVASRHEAHNNYVFLQNGLNSLQYDLNYVGSRSDLYKFATAKYQEDYRYFSSHRVTCSHYSYRLSDNPRISHKFYKAFESLPYSYSSSTKTHYRNLINTYGTHYTRQVELGGQLNRVRAACICSSSLKGLSSKQVHSCLKLGISVGLGHTAVAHIKTCNNILYNQDVSTTYYHGLQNHYTQVVGGNGWSGEFSLIREDSQGYINWLKTLTYHPDVVKYSLRSLHELVPDYKRKIALKAAIQDYLSENAIRPSIQAGYGSQILIPSKCCSQKVWWGQLVVTIIRGWGYAVLKYKNDVHRTHEVSSNEPVWNSKFIVGKVETHQSLTLQVWHKDYRQDVLLVSCPFNVLRGSHTQKCSSLKGNVEYKYTLTCDQYYTGDQCNQYNKPIIYG